MKGSEENPQVFDVIAFLKDLEDIKQKYRIAVIGRRTSETDARRIAILVSNCYLQYGGNTHQAGFLERHVYEAVKMLDLRCNPIPEEIIIEELAGKRGNRGVYTNFNPLKLSIEGKEQYLTTYTSLIAIIIRKINVIEENKHDRVCKPKDRRFDQRRASHANLRSRKLNHQKVEDGKKIALREAGEKVLRTGAGFHELVHETEGCSR